MTTPVERNSDLSFLTAPSTVDEPPRRRYSEPILNSTPQPNGDAPRPSTWHWQRYQSMTALAPPSSSALEMASTQPPTSEYYSMGEDVQDGQPGSPSESDSSSVTEASHPSTVTLEHPEGREQLGPVDEANTSGYESYASDPDPVEASDAPTSQQDLTIEPDPHADTPDSVPYASEPPIDSSADTPTSQHTPPPEVASVAARGPRKSHDDTLSKYEPMAPQAPPAQPKTPKRGAEEDRYSRPMSTQDEAVSHTQPTMERPSESRTSKQSRSIESAHPLLPGSPQSPRQAQTVDAITAELRNGEPDRRATVVAPERPQRPPLRAQDSSLVQSEYMNMLLALDAVPQLHNLLASFFTWILLAGFVVLPGTFSTLKQIQTTTGAASLVLHAVQHVSLFVIAYVCCAIGAGGMSWLWWRWRGNYIWLLNRIFLPGAMNGLAGVLSTIASVFGAQQGNFTASSITTMAVTGACTVICGGLTAFYTFFKLGAVKKRHEREIGREKAGKHGEGWLEEAKERAQQPEPERGVFR